MIHLGREVVKWNAKGTTLEWCPMKPQLILTIVYI